MYQGRFEHSVDDKGRIAIPAPFRKALQDSQEPSLVVTLADQCLSAYPQSTWKQKVEAISKLNQLDPAVLAFKRIFIGCAQECPIDKAGRMLIPADLRRDAHIERETIFLGQIDKFEIWSQDIWTSSYSQMSDQLGNIFENLANQGIQI